MVDILNCRTLVKGFGKGMVLATLQTISFWGGS